VLSVRAIRYMRERWVTPDGQTIVAPLPEGTRGHFGPDLRRFVLMQYHQGQTTLPRLTALWFCQRSRQSVWSAWVGLQYWLPLAGSEIDAVYGMPLVGRFGAA
jgi:hypothetical protein